MYTDKTNLSGVSGLRAALPLSWLQMINFTRHLQSIIMFVYIKYFINAMTSWEKKTNYGFSQLRGSRHNASVCSC